MKRCARKNFANALLPIFCLLVGAGLITLSACACVGVSFFPILFTLFLPFTAGLGLITLSLFLYLDLTREYAADARGITLRYLRRFTVTYPWEQVTSIVLCDLGDRLTDRTFPIVIRIAACEEKCGPFAQPRSYNLLGGMDKWRTDFYHLRRYLSIITIDFNEDALQEIAEASGREIRECWSSPARRDIAYRRMNRAGNPG